MKFENTEVWGFKHALRGLRNPMNSWHKSDSFYIQNCKQNGRIEPIVIGENDLKLAQKLIKAGTEHRKFLRQIFVSVDITAPLYFFKEYDTYKVGTVANSTSTMHKITSVPFDISQFSCDMMSDETKQHMQAVIDYLEVLRLKYLETKDKQVWYNIIQFLPSSYNQMRTCTMNYENIISMYHQRKNHKMNEWSGKDNPDVPNFCSWVKSLPYAKELILINE